MSIYHKYEAVQNVVKDCGRVVLYCNQAKEYLPSAVVRPESWAPCICICFCIPHWQPHPAAGMARRAALMQVRAVQSGYRRLFILNHVYAFYRNTSHGRSVKHQRPEISRLQCLLWSIRIRLNEPQRSHEGHKYASQCCIYW